MKNRFPLILGMPLLLGGCLFGPNFHGAPDMGLPVTWVNHMPPTADDAAGGAWWGRFGDAQLTALIQQGLAANPDVISAALAIARAETQLRSARADLFPSVNGSVNGVNGGSFRSSTSHGQWNGGLSLAWSPDIWGGTRREVEAAMANVGSARAAAAATNTALASAIATTYFEWISATESLRSAREQLVYQQRTFDIVEKRVAAGFQNRLDLEQARVTIANTRAQIPTYEANIKTCCATLATLVGTTPDRVQLRMPAPPVFNRIPRVPTGLPSELLRRRPDVVAAEYNLHRATANIGVQVANLFPHVSLTGNVSASAPSDFADFFRSAGWSLSSSVSQVLFNRVQLRANVRLARIAEMESAQTYRKTVLAAFAEVEENLIDYARLTNQLPQYEQAARSSKEAAELALRLYNSGYSDYLNVATAERSWLNARLNVIAARQQIRITLARLVTALGGGF